MIYNKLPQYLHTVATWFYGLVDLPVSSVLLRTLHPMSSRNGR